MSREKEVTETEGQKETAAVKVGESFISPLFGLRKLTVYYSFFGITTISNPDGEAKVFKVNK